jgi:hypothetical protein
MEDLMSKLIPYLWYTDEAEEAASCASTARRTD